MGAGSTMNPMEDKHKSLHSQGDNALLRQVALHRDANSFKILCERYKSAIHSLAHYITQHADLAEDASQEALLRVWKYAKSFDPDKGSARSWILRVVARQSIEAAKKSKRKNQVISLENLSEQPIKETRPQTSTPSESAERGELVEALRRVLSRLTGPERQMVALYYGGGLTHQEIADTLDMPKRTVSFKISNALEHLRRSLTSAGFAGAISVLDFEVMADAICGNLDAPANLQATVMRQIAEDLKMNEPTTNLPGIANKNAWIWLVGVGVIGVVATGTWWQHTSNPSHGPTQASETAAITSSDKSKMPANSDEALVNRVWTFKDGPAPDLTPTYGKFIWNKKRGIKGGMLVPDHLTKVVIVLPLKAPKRPFLMRVRGEYLVSGPVKIDGKLIRFRGASITAFWGDGHPEADALLVEKKWSRKAPSSGNNRLIYTVLFSDRHVLYYSGNELIAILKTKQTYPNENFYIAFSGGKQLIHSIQVRTLHESEMFEDFQHPEALIKTWEAGKAPQKLPEQLLKFIAP